MENYTRYGHMDDVFPEPHLMDVSQLEWAVNKTVNTPGKSSNLLAKYAGKPLNITLIKKAGLRN